MSTLQSTADAWAAPLVADLDGLSSTSRAFTRTTTGHEVGSLTVHDGTIGARPVRVVDTRLVLPDLGIDSMMLHAFSPGDSSSPHLLSDLAGLVDAPDDNGDGGLRWHFHVDLMPRVDLVASTDYLDGVYAPLTETFEAVRAVPGMRPIDIPPRLRSLASGWLIGAIVSPRDVGVVDSAFGTYADRWRHLVIDPPATTSSPDALKARDLHHRAAMFDPVTDIVWAFLADLIGQDDVDAVLAAIRGED